MRGKEEASAGSGRLAGGGERIWTRVDEDGAPSVSKEIEPAPAPAPGTGPQMKTTASGSEHGSSEHAPLAVAARGGCGLHQPEGSPPPSPLVLPMLAEQRSGRRRRP